MNKHNQIDRVIANGLACLMAAGRKFNVGDAAAIVDAFGALIATARRAENLEERVKKLEQQAKSSRSKQAPVVSLREVG